MYTESKRNKLEAKYKVNTAHSLRAISTALFKFFPVFFFIQQHSLVSTWSHFLCVYLFHCACLCFNYFISFPRTTCTVFYNYTLFSTRRFGMSEKTTSQNATKGNRRWLRWMGKRLSLSSSFWNRISRSCFIASNDLCADQMVPNRIYEDRTQHWHWKL